MLNTLIRDQIARDGFIAVDDYMRLCLLHPDHGYYTTREVFGAQGDFTTAPEISQLFGEVIGIWAVMEWDRLGNPDRFNLVEWGPGRGTLMWDLLRATRQANGFHAACHVHFIEASPRLQAIQQQAVAHENVPAHWHRDGDHLPADAPTIMIANEFFDALPVRHYVAHNRVWHERVIMLDNDKLVWSMKPDQTPDYRMLPDARRQKDGTICEYSPEAETIFKSMCRHLRKQTGSLVAIDYGDHTANRFGDTLQAVKDHAYHDVLADPGEADVTAHVDFYQLDQVAANHGLETLFTTQADFLKRYGITERVNKLAASAATIEQKNALIAGYQRLIDPDQMGQLFKTLIVTTPSDS